MSAAPGRPQARPRRRNTRRRLPTRVYWVRRVAVLGTVLALVFAIGRLVVLHGGGGPSEAATTVANQSPAQSSSQPTPSASDPTFGPSVAPSPSATPSATATAPIAPTSVPTGPCADADVVVTPAVAAVAGGGQVVLPMNLTTNTGSACTWRVSSTSLVLKVSKASDRVWSSQDCPSVVPAQDLIVRPAAEQATQVLVPWDGHRSVQGCAGGQAWATPGNYTVTAASLGGTPAKATFRLVAPPRPVVTKTAKPKKVVKTPKG